MSATKFPVETEIEDQIDGWGFKQVETGKAMPFLAL